MPRVRVSDLARRRRAIAASLMAIGLAAGVYATWRFGDEVASRIKPGAHTAALREQRQAAPAAAAPVQPAQTVSPERPIYPYSIVSGGVHSVAELRLAIQFDPVVAAHFANFDLDQTRVERVAVSKAVYVSYRKGSQVRWTGRRVSLRAGETILTDGVNTARTRCGNRIAEVLPAAVSAEDEPSPEVLETPLPARSLPIDPLVAYDMFAAEGEMPAALDAAEPLLPSSPLPGAGLDSSYAALPGMDFPQIPLLPIVPFGVVTGGGADLEPVPEPATLLLLSPGLAAYALWRRHQRRRSAPTPPAN